MKEKKDKVKICVNCGTTFLAYRNKAKFCSTKCVNKAYNNTGKAMIFRRASVENTLRTIVWHARQRAKKKNLIFEIDEEYILNLLKKQDGKCAATGIKLESSKANTKKYKSPFTISLDRIDSDKGYTKDNVQLVCIMFNEMKNIYTMKEVIFMCKAFILHNNIDLGE